jgi:hypothetical protein
MLFLETVEEWKGLNVPLAGSILLNTNRIGAFKLRASTKSGFFYTLRPEDRRDKAGYVHATTSVANIIVAMDDVLTSNAMLLKEYPNGDITATPVDKYIDYADFVYAVAYPGDATKSIVTYGAKSFALIKAVVNESLASLEEIAETGTTS